MIGMLKAGWELLNFREVRAMGLQTPSTIEDENVFVRNTETKEVLRYREYCQKYETTQAA
jgi:hypothetical protein